jgi:hypothetical protein
MPEESNSAADRSNMALVLVPRAASTTAEVIWSGDQSRAIIGFWRSGNIWHPLNNYDSLTNYYTTIPLTAKAKMIER